MTTEPTLTTIMSTLRGDNRTGHKAVLWLRTRNVNDGSPALDLEARP